MSECCFRLERKCAVLNKMECEKCSFRKTREELEEGRIKAMKRLMSLSPEERCYIADKYGLYILKETEDEEM